MCPHYRIRQNAYFLQSCKCWCYKHCKRHFYITTNTAFAFHKLPFIDILATILLFVNEVKGISAILMSRHLNVNYKTAFVLCHKLHEALLKTHDLTPSQGKIHEDGTLINFKLHKTNYRKNDYKQKEKNKDGKTYRKLRKTKRYIISLNQRASNNGTL